MTTSQKESTKKRRISQKKSQASKTPQKQSKSSQRPHTPSRFSLKSRLHAMHAGQRIKAFITDMFMVNMPLLYFTTYVFLDGKDSFLHNQYAILACSLIYGIVLSLFFAFSSQTPGYRYVGLKLVHFCKENTESSTSTHHSKNEASQAELSVGFIRAFIRYMLWVFGTSFLFGLAIGLFRKDGRCLHDILCGTYIIEAKSKKE